jgi:hypothetical protein
MPASIRPIPLYTTSGDLGGFLLYPHIFNSQGDWIGWVTADKQVYSVHGQYVGWMSKDFRILRQRTFDSNRPQQTPPPPPARFRPPAQVPLPPMMAEITSSTIDVLEERPDLLPTLDSFAFTDDVG